MDKEKDLKHECDSECNCEDEECMVDLITLTDEDGVEHTFEIVDTLEKDNESYMALVTSSENPDEYLEDDGNLIIMKVVGEEDGEDILATIDDDDEFEKISEIFMDRLSDLFEFDDDTEE
ncbi:MAG: DUF1292 domain-containing protein [Oscillospiraceae bacterium]